MARKWSNLNIPGALHYITGNFYNRLPVFSDPDNCKYFLEEAQKLIHNWPCKLVTYVLMPDHLHMIVNPRDGRIKEFIGTLKALAAKAIIRANIRFQFAEAEKGHQVWQESFKSLQLWSDWMIWQKINYIHANPVKARLVKSAKDYRWSGFRSFYSLSNDPLEVDRDWWWPEDVEKLRKIRKENNWHTHADLRKSGGR